MYRNICLFGYTALVCVLPGALAAPAPLTSTIDKRWFTINPAAGGAQFWPNHKLQYKFKDDNSKDKLKDILQAGWKLWTDNGLQKDKIDLVEASDGEASDVLTISVTSEKQARTRVGFSGGAEMRFGDSDDYGLLDKSANMAHELGHALGFQHEHQRYDRNDHVVFNCKNLKDYSEDKEKEGFCTDMEAAIINGWSSVEWIPYPQSNSHCAFGPTYDEASIMHYPGGAGGNKGLLGLGHRDTVLGTKADPNKSFQKNTKPSQSDIDRANEMYSNAGMRKRAEQCGPPDSGSDGGALEDAEDDTEDQQEEVEEQAEEDEDDNDD